MNGKWGGEGREVRKPFTRKVRIIAEPSLMSVGGHYGGRDDESETTQVEPRATDSPAISRSRGRNPSLFAPLISSNWIRARNLSPLPPWGRGVSGDGGEKVPAKSGGYGRETTSGPQAPRIPAGRTNLADASVYDVPPENARTTAWPSSSSRAQRTLRGGGTRNLPAVSGEDSVSGSTSCPVPRLG